jgi:hypothetical protein
MAFSPMNIPPGSGPEEWGSKARPWYRRWYVWAILAAVFIGSLNQILR